MKNLQIDKKILFKNSTNVSFLEFAFFKVEKLGENLYILTKICFSRLAFAPFLWSKILVFTNIWNFFS